MERTLVVHEKTRRGNFGELRRPLHQLVPTMEVQQRLEEQEAALARRWRLAKLLKKKKEDEADWWKRGEDPPY